MTLIVFAILYLCILFFITYNTGFNRGYMKKLEEELIEKGYLNKKEDK